MIEIELFATEEGITDISLVEYPAIESNWMCFAKDVKMYFADDERHIITGAVLIPDKRIYRNDENGEYDVFFSKDTIRSIAEKFLQNFKNKSFTLEHTDNTNDVTMVESWIKEYDFDKSNAIGFDLPVGTWFISAKIRNENLWKAIKDGVFRGFSVAGMFDARMAKSPENDSENAILEEAEDFLKEN